MVFTDYFITNSDSRQVTEKNIFLYKNSRGMTII